MSRRQRVVTRSAFGLLMALALIVLVAVSITQTGYGRDQLRKLILSRISKNVQGKVYIGRMGGSLFGGVTVDSLEIRDELDSLFIATGPMRIVYDSRDILDKRILIRYAEVLRPKVNLRQDADGSWNYRKIFARDAGGPASKGPGFGDFIVVDSARIEGASFNLMMPWRPDDSLRGHRRDSAIAFELARSDHEIRRTRDGFVRAWRWTKGNVLLGHSRIADPDSTGRKFLVRDAGFSGFDPPMTFRNIRAEIRHLGDSIWLDAPHFALPASTGRAKGKIVWGSDLPIRYAIDASGDRVSLSDVAWVYPTLPTTGGGRMKLSIRNDPGNLRVIDYAVTAMDVRTTGSRVMGAMTYGVGGPVLVLKNVDLVADPVDFDLLRTLNGKPFPYDWQGKIRGNVVASGGPLNRFRVDESRFTFSDAHVPGAFSTFTGSGELDIFTPAFTAFHDFSVDAERLDLRTLQYLNPLFPRLRGIVTGTAQLDSSWLDVRFRNADMTHIDGNSPRSRVTGRGRVTWGTFLVYDLDLEARPLSLATLARSYPGLPVKGDLSGPLRIRGTSPSLQVVAELRGPSGAFTFNGVVDADPAAYGARGHGTFAQLDLRELLVGTRYPATTLNGGFALEMSGASVESLAGSVAANLRKSVIAEVPLDGAIARVKFGAGFALIDTLVVRGPVGEGRASGTVALAAGKSGRLTFDAAIDSLAMARSYFRALGMRPSLTDSLTGSARASGEISGSLARPVAKGKFEASRLLAGGRSAGGISGEFDVRSFQPLRGNVSVIGSQIGIGTFVLARGDIRASLDSGRGRYEGSLQASNGITGRVTGTLLDGETFRSFSIDSLSFGGENIGRYALESPALVKRWDRGITVDSLKIRHESNARLAVRGVRLADDSLSAAIRTEGVDLGLLSAVIPGLARASGAMQANIEIGGTTRQPRLDGEFRIANGEAILPGIGADFRKINANISLTRDTIFVRALSVETDRERRGRGSVEGFVSLENYGKPVFALRATARDLHVLERDGVASLDISTGTPLTITGRYDAAVIRGGIRVDRGTLYIPELIEKNIVDIDDPEFAGLADTAASRNRTLLPSAPSEFARNLSLENLAVEIGEDVWLRSSEANIKLGGSLDITLGPGSPGAARSQLALQGTLNAVRGSYRLSIVEPFVQPSFDVESGTLRFFGTPEIDPALDIKAVHTIRQARQSVSGRDVRVRVNIGGTLSSPRLRLDSPDNLPLSEADLLSYLVTGEQGLALNNTPEEYKSQIASFVVRYGGSLLTNAIPRSILDIVELQTARVDPGVNANAANPYYNNLLNTRAILGKQIGARWFLSLSTGLCVLNRASFLENLGLKLEYRFNATYTVEAGLEPGSSERACARTTSASEFQQRPSQAGFDFFRTWRF